MMNIDIGRLSYQQHNALDSISKSSKFISIASNITEKQLIESLKKEGVSIGNEVPYKGLVLSLASCGCHLTSIEQKQLLLALSRTPETKIISIPLFMSLFRYWSKSISQTTVTSPSSSSVSSFSYTDKVKYDTTVKLSNIRQVLELQLPHIVYLLDVIPERLTHDISPDVSSDKFMRLLRASNINLSNDNFMQLINALRKTGLCTENDEINLKKLIEVCQSKGSMTSNNIEHNVQATPITRLLEVVRQRWPDLERRIQASSWNKDAISVSTFLLICNSCGIQIAEKDIYSLWAHMNIASSPSAKLINTEENLKLRTLSLDIIRGVIIGTSNSSNYSCMGNVMRDTPSKNIRKNSYHEQPSTIGNLIYQVKSDNPSNNAIPAAISSPTALPWSTDEATEENNLKTRVKTAIKQISRDKYKLFLETLKKSTYASKGLITRYGLSESLLSINLRLNKNDTEDLWSQGNKFSKGSLSIEAFGAWMNIDINIQDVISSTTAETSPGIFEQSIVSDKSRTGTYYPPEYHNKQKHHFYVNQESIPVEVPDHAEKHHYSKTLQEESTEELENHQKHHYLKTQQLESVEPTHHHHESTASYLAHNMQDSDVWNPKETQRKFDPYDSLYHTKAHNIEESDVWNPTVPEPLKVEPHDSDYHVKAHNMEESEVWNTNDIGPPPPPTIDDSTIDVLDLLPRVPYRYSHHNSSKMSNLLTSNEDPLTIVDNEEFESQSEMNLRKQAIAQLQEQRPQLAVAFRKRIGLGSRLVENGIKCKDLVSELLQPPFSLDISENVAWRLVCDMIGISYSSDLDKAYILYADVIDFLDSEKETVEGYATTQLKNSLKRKLFDSNKVLGDKVNLFALTSTLRQRQRHALGRGQASWDATPDYCTVKELIKLLETIDIAITFEEAKFICSNSSDDDETHTNDIGVRLGEAILFLGSLIDL